MKKLLFIIFCILSIFGYSQNSQDEYYRVVDWKFYPGNIIQLTDSTYETYAIPFDYNDPGAISRTVGNYVVDFIGHRYAVVDSTSVTITLLDIYHTGQGPQTDQIARCYRSVYNGDSKYIGSIDYSPLDESAKWKLNGSDNELLWRHGIDYGLPFKRLVLDTTYIHDGYEVKGTVAWNEATQSVETHIANDLHLNNGEELWVPLCINNSGSDILNGQPVYINGASGISPTILLASNITYDESRLIGVATQNIPNGTVGRVTRFGFVNDINLSECTAGGNVYLGDKVLTHVRPMGGLFPVVIGKAIVCSTTGRLLVYPQTAEYPSEVNRADGWASYLQGDQTNISFVDGTRIFSIVPVASTFYFYQVGLKYIKTGTQSITISDVEGIHIIYYDLGVLSEMVNPSSSEIVDAIRNKVITSVIYWDATNKVSIYVSNERHTFYWPSWVHAYAHLSFGTQFGNGLALTNITLGIGSVNADAQFGSDAGTIADEDIVTSVPSVSSTTGIPIYYRLGSGLGNWRRVVRAGYAFLNDGTSGLAMYNLNSGGTWSITTMTNNYYRLVHVFATNDIGTPNKIIAMSGVAEYSSASAAEAAVNNEILNIYNSNLPFAEVKHIGSLILHTKTGLGNTVNARYVAIPSKPSGANYYMDYRRSNVIGTGGGAGSGTSTILGLSDTPDSYAAQSNKLFGVNAVETGMEFKAVTATLAGTVNIPTGQQYQINGGSVVVDAINDAVTTTAPSQNSVFDALALKAPTSIASSLSTGYLPYWDGTKFLNSTATYDSGWFSFGTSPVPGYRIFATGNIRALGNLEAYSAEYTGNTGVAQNIALFGQIGFSNGFTVAYNGLSMVYTMLDGDLRLGNLSGTGIRLITASPDGTLGALANGLEGQIPKIVSGVLTFADASDGLNTTGMTANFIQKWDGEKFIDWINPRPQTLTASLTTVWDVNSGIDANMTMTADASITLQNLKVSTSGTLHVTKQSTNYRLKLKGYTLSISRNIEWDSTGILIVGNGKEDSYTWTYNGVVLTINGNKDYNQTSF